MVMEIRLSKSVGLEELQAHSEVNRLGIANPAELRRVLFEEFEEADRKRGVPFLRPVRVISDNYRMEFLHELELNDGEEVFRRGSTPSFQGISTPTSPKPLPTVPFLGSTQCSAPSVAVSPILELPTPPVKKIVIKSGAPKVTPTPPPITPTSSPVKTTRASRAQGITLEVWPDSLVDSAHGYSPSPVKRSASRVISPPLPTVTPSPPVQPVSNRELIGSVQEPPVNIPVQPKKVTESVYEVPGTLLEFLKEHPRCLRSEAERYFGKREIDKKIRLGIISSRSGRLYI